MFFGKLVTLTAAALGVAHCAEPAAPSLVRFTSGSEPPKSPHYDGTAPVPAQIGTPFTLSMGANPTTGYSWAASKPTEQLFTSEATPNAPFSLLQNTYVIDRHPRGMVGVGGRQYVEVRAAKAGRYVLVMEYRRPWEKTAAQKREFEVQVAAEPSR
eukprot:TRINITY_DN796_c0_g1_i1.p1 TRINITY_DN796_c0_g1~~TRINITY_DN796_c0_g1_i1.p1  ORF type:complete len:180 (+),score=95.28 TRINITY_DN796_c0_g1_i1:75-542(+)